MFSYLNYSLKCLMFFIIVTQLAISLPLRFIMSYAHCLYASLPAGTPSHVHEFTGQPLRQEPYGWVRYENLDTCTGSNSISLCACVWTHVHSHTFILRICISYNHWLVKIFILPNCQYCLQMSSFDLIACLTSSPNIFGYFIQQPQS